MSKLSYSTDINLISYLKKKVCFFKAGQIANDIEFLKQNTSDNTILQIVKGDIIDFQQDLPVLMSYPHNSVSEKHVQLIAQELQSLFEKQVIAYSNNEVGQFISPIYTVSKSDAKIRLILNLKKLNTYVEYVHFKMKAYIQYFNWLHIGLGWNLLI